MKKLLFLFLVTIFAFSLSACQPKETPGGNVIPSISGVVAEVDIDLGQSFDALDGVTASDEEDGDLTDSIVVTSIPALTFTDGVATPVDTGDYYITYTITDSDGAEVEEYTTLIVNEVVGGMTVFSDSTFE